MNKNDQIIVSAPGKLMLFGEHAVVHGKPSIVTAVNQRLKLKAQRLEKDVFQLEAPDVEITDYEKPLGKIGLGEVPKGAKFVEIALKNFLEMLKQVQHDKIENGVRFETVAGFKSTFGFGSSSASTVCAIKALTELFNVKLTNKEIFDLCYKTVLDVQGTGSGFDLAAAIYGGTLSFVIGGKVIEPIKIDELPMVVGYTGVKADTVTLIKQVNKFKDENPDFVEGIFNKMEQIAMEAKQAFTDKDFEELGELMNLNQTELGKLGVSSPELDNLILAAREAGAWGAKLSGAGGGDCMIAFASEEKRKKVEEAIEKAGGQVLRVEGNTEGVRIEE